MTVYKVGLSKAANHKNSKTRRVWGVFLAITLASLLVAYVVQTNDISTKGFAIKVLERKVAELERQVNERQADLSTRKSLDTIKTSAELSKFVAVERVQYLSGVVPTSGVAVR
ncbi:TPA: hypothetical protein DIC39_02745 [Patescibacteria group bacterium]|nr:MAG: hypothetical protein UX54_C0019G0003 [Parcubacteria group bacterium GW2011_GWA2_46_39]HBV33253.1 hypothetical protein [Patescibacteria group bacterium]HCU47952.1 hypothetical protein [Patescibacteria group bacterium]